MKGNKREGLGGLNLGVGCIYIGKGFEHHQLVTDSEGLELDFNQTTGNESKCTEQYGYQRMPFNNTPPECPPNNPPLKLANHTPAICDSKPFCRNTRLETAGRTVWL